VIPITERGEGKFSLFPRPIRAKRCVQTPIASTSLPSEASKAPSNTERSEGQFPLRPSNTERSEGPFRAKRGAHR